MLHRGAIELLLDYHLDGWVQLPIGRWEIVAVAMMGATAVIVAITMVVPS